MVKISRTHIRQQCREPKGHLFLTDIQRNWIYTLYDEGYTKVQISDYTLASRPSINNVLTNRVKYKSTQYSITRSRTSNFDTVHL